MATPTSLPHSSSHASNSPQTHPHPRRKPRRTHLEAPGPETDGHVLPSIQNGERSPRARGAMLAMRPASVHPGFQSQSRQNPASRPRPGNQDPATSSTNLTASASGPNHGYNHSSRGNRLHRGQRGRANPTVSSTGRQFGGHLTTHHEVDQTPGKHRGLQPDAPEFRPGQAVTDRDDQSKGDFTDKILSNDQQATRKRRDSKSTAPDIKTRIHEDMMHNLYECPICTNNVGRFSKIWSCRTCWTVFHLTCVKKWAQNEGSTHAPQQPQNDGRMWRCPGCNLPKEIMPKLYTCWCEKEIDPPISHGLAPHSCGQTCGRLRIMPKQCPHPCELQCHAGPCPPCTHMGPTKSCFCGKKSARRQCAETNYEEDWSCEEPCDRTMACGVHRCTRPCHSGSCGPCSVSVEARCYCGQVEQPLACHLQGEPIDSQGETYEHGAEAIQEWTGTFNCGKTCGRSFDCGKHRCQKQCHAQEAQPSHCPRSADVVAHCPCGKTPILEILDRPRESCDSEIPNCKKKCLKLLACGHQCQGVCHSGNCFPCLEKTEISCRCGRVTSSTVCHQGREEAPQCMRTCRATLNCGRHECGERCCSGEKRAAERKAGKKKLRLAGEDIEAEHICTRVCGRPLKCGNHTCPELCHKGACGSCREAIFFDLACNCGRTVLQPPIPCGTKPPPCRFDCGRIKACGHRQVSHNCHGDDEPCPKCPFLVEKACACGKKTLKNQPCWLLDPRCGEVCGRMLKCGSHTCQLPCHRPGFCEDADTACQQACGKTKTACDHPCRERCHAPAVCPEDKPCTEKIIITCPCQHLKQTLPCLATRSSKGNLEKGLKCTEACKEIARKHQVADAFGINMETHTNGHIPYSSTTLSMYGANTTWAATQEKLLRGFAANPEERRFRFKPMISTRRAFIHSLADDFALDSESMDPEPHRHVAVFKTPRFVSAPLKTLKECVSIKEGAEKEARREAMAAYQEREDAKRFNAFILSVPRFGITVQEIQSELSLALNSTRGLQWEIEFLPTEEVVLRPSPSVPGTTITDANLESTLRSIKAQLVSLVSAKNTATSVQLARVDGSMAVLLREHESSQAAGWSTVAAKGAAKNRLVEKSGFGGSNVFTVLGRKRLETGPAAFAPVEKPSKRKESIVEDWEEAVRLDEEAENKANGVEKTVEDQTDIQPRIAEDVAVS